MIEKILSSPFGSDFEPSLINVSTYEGGDNTLKVDSSYGPEGGSAIALETEISIEGGTLVLADEPLASYTIADIVPEVMIEEILIEEATNTIELATEANTFVVIAEAGTRPGLR